MKSFSFKETQVKIKYRTFRHSLPRSREVLDQFSAIQFPQRSPAVFPKRHYKCIF